MNQDNPLAAAAETFSSTIAARNRREWAACAVVVVAFTWFAFRASSLLERIFSLEIVAAACFVAWHLHRNSRVRLRDAAHDPAFPRLYAAELRRHARILRTVPWWYLAPLAVGLIGLEVSRSRSASAHRSPLSLVTIAAVFILIAWLNVRAARRLELRAVSVAEGRGDPGGATPSARSRSLGLVVFVLSLGVAIVIFLLSRKAP